LKRNTAKYYFGEKSSFLHTFLKICCESRKIEVKVKDLFNFNAISVLKKVNLNVWQTCHVLFEISGVPVWFRSHHIFKCFLLGGNRASTMSHQTAPTPLYRQPSPLSVWQHNLHPFGREL
jgi:hypothetical protein